MDKDREILLDAILNYIEDHITEDTDDCWGSFKGVKTSDFSASELLSLIYYISPYTFNSLKYTIKKAKEENEND